MRLCYGCVLWLLFIHLHFALPGDNCRQCQAKRLKYWSEAIEGFRDVPSLPVCLPSTSTFPGLRDYRDAHSCNWYRRHYGYLHPGVLGVGKADSLLRDEQKAWAGLELAADFEDLLAVLFYFCRAHAGDFLELIWGGGLGVGDGAQGAVVEDYEGRHAELFCDGGAPGFQGLFELLGGWG